jgi:hypothetical protein
LLTVMPFGMPLDVIDIIGIILLIGIVKAPIGADIEVALILTTWLCRVPSSRSGTTFRGNYSGPIRLQLSNHLPAVGHHRASLNRSFTETSIWDAVIPAGKGGSCAPRISGLRAGEPRERKPQINRSRAKQTTALV